MSKRSQLVFDMSKYDKMAEAAYKSEKGRAQLESIVRDVIASGYRSLSDAADVTGDDRYAGRGTKIWYVKPDHIRDFNMGYGWVEKKTPELLPNSPQDLKDTHILLGEVGERDQDEVFEMMQGMNWSPEGQANSLIRSKGLKHTSMSVGDIIQVGSRAYMVDNTGFKRVASYGKTARPSTHDGEKLLMHIENNYDLHQKVRKQEKELMQSLLDGKQPGARSMMPVVEDAAASYFEEYAPKDWKDMFSADDIKGVAAELTKYFLSDVKDGEVKPDLYDLDGQVDRTMINPRAVRADFEDNGFLDRLTKRAFDNKALRPHLLPLISKGGEACIALEKKLEDT